ncbi:hypothetical protein IKF73_02285 [Candidatus Saccharibacteria bacterium]|nr:hypothetical protein [Candidatus Saccharibacteria bacterium]
MPEDTYGSGGGVEGGVSNPAEGQGGGTAGPVSADEVVDSVSTSVAPPNPVSVSATPSSTPVSVTPNPFVGQGGAVGNPNVISSANFGAGMGDVVLNKSSDKAKKVGIIVAVAVVLVLVIVGVVVWVMTGRNSGALKKFESLSQYLENGTGFKKDEENAEEEEEAEAAEEVEEEDPANDWIYAIRISSEGADTISKYYAGLEKKEEEFFNSFNKNDEVVDEYKFALQVLKNAINYQEVGKKLIEIYSNEGAEGVKKYFDEDLACGTGDSALNGICVAEQNYYDAVVKEHALYADIGCAQDNYYDALCAMEYYGEGEFFGELNALEPPTSYLQRFSGVIAENILNQNIVKLSNSILEKLGNA